MDAENFIKYAIVGVVLFFVISTIVSLILTVLTFVFATAVTIAAIGVFIFLMSAVFKGVSNNQSSKERNRETSMSQKDRIEKLKQRYINDNISDEEFEKRLDLEFGGADEEFVMSRERQKDYNN